MLMKVSMPIKLIIFDLHNVLFRMDYRKVVHIIWHTSPKLPLITVPCNPRFWWNFFSLIKKNAVGEEYVVRMAQWHKRLQPFVATGIEIINAQKPQTIVVELIKELKNDGYTIFGLSNIGEQACKHLCSNVPDIMELFDQLIPTTIDDDYIRKPDKRAFAKALALSKHAPSETLFIDDNKRNIAAASKLSMQTIHFISPHQLKKNLAQLQKTNKNIT